MEKKVHILMKALLLSVYVVGLGMIAFLVFHALRSDSRSTSWLLAFIWSVALLLIVRVTFRVFTT